MKDISLKDLLEAGCHFGHQTTRWNPKMSSYIYIARDGIHIFDLAKTKKGLEEAAAFAKATASQGQTIIFVGTKRQSQEIVKATAVRLGMPYMTERWIGGLLTNWEYVYKRIEHLRDLKAGMAENRFKDRTKKERLLISREIVKMEKDFGGIEELRKIPEAIFIVDARKDISAVKEAHIRGVKIMAIVDTNANPEMVDFPIPANDDAAKSIQLIINTIAEAVEEGKTNLKNQSAKIKTEDEKKEIGEDKEESVEKVKSQKVKAKRIKVKTEKTN